MDNVISLKYLELKFVDNNEILIKKKKDNFAFASIHTNGQLEIIGYVPANGNRILSTQETRELSEVIQKVLFTLPEQFYNSVEEAFQDLNNDK